MTVRFGIIGCGAAATRIHLPGLREAGAEVTAFASRHRGRAEAARAEWGGGWATTDWTDLLRATDVDAVVICTPNALHEPAAVAAAEAGKHVLVEKPMARTVAEADRMIAAAERAGVVLAPAHNLRLVAPFRAMAEAVRGGAIGGLTSVRGAFGHGGPETWAPDAGWFRDPELAGGGALIDLGIHLADLIRAVTGDEVVEVAAFVDATPIDDHAQAALRFASGAVGTMAASWAVRPGPDHQLTLFGTEATLHLDSRTAPVRLAAGKDPEPLPKATGRVTVHGDVVAAIADGRQLSATAADGRAALAIVEAAYRSAASGHSMSVSEV